MDVPRITLRMIRMPQICQGCISLFADDPRIHLRDHPQCSRNTPGLHRDVQGHPGWVYRPCRHSRMGFKDRNFSHRYQLIDKGILFR